MALRALQGPTGGGAPVGGTGTTNTIPRWTGASTLGDSGLIDNGTAVYTTTRTVGFGTATPTGRLHATQADATVNMLFAGTSMGVRWRFTATESNIEGVDNTGLVAFRPLLLSGSTVALGIAGSAKLTVDNSGNVGIGTATPVGRADVAGTSVNQSGWGLLSVQSNDAQGADKGGSITFGGVYDASTATHWAQISGRKENGTSGQYGGYLAFATRTNGAGTNTERARIDSAGRMCIGTTTATTGRALTTVADLDVFGVRVGRGPGDIASNTAIGAGALSFCSTGSENTALGQNAGFGISTGVRNVMIGAATGSGGTVTGSRNIVVGRQAGNQLTSGSDNVLLGTQAGDSVTTGSSNIVIGSGADLAAATDSNKLVIGDATNYVATNGGATTYYATAGALAGYIIVRLNGTDVKLPVYAL